MLAAFTFNTAENLPIGLLELISVSLHVPLSAVGLLVTGYGVTVAAASLPLAHALFRAVMGPVAVGLFAPRAARAGGPGGPPPCGDLWFSAQRADLSS